MICRVKPYEGREPYIFFSYCHADEAKVYPIIETLMSKGYRIWYDEGIHPGEDWPEVIAQHLAEAKFFMASVSKSSVNSHNCRNEMTFAVENQKKIITLILEDFTLPLGTKLQLATTQMIKAFEYSITKFYEKIYSTDNIDECKGRPVKLLEPETEIRKKEVIENVPSTNNDDRRVRTEEIETSNKKIEEFDRQQDELRKKLAELERLKNEENERKAKAEEAERLRLDEEEKQKKAEEERIRREAEDKKNAEIEERVRKEVEKRLRKAEEERISKEVEEKIKKTDTQKKFLNENNLSDDETVMNSDDETVMDSGDETIIDSDDVTRLGSDADDTQLENEGTPPILVQLETGLIFVGKYPMTSIGRSHMECDIYFESKPTITSRHADIIIHGGHNYIVDQNSSNHTYVNGKMLEKNGRAEIPNYAEVSLSRSEKFFVAFDEYADEILRNMMLVSLFSVATREKFYIFEDSISLGRSYPWASGAMSDKAISREHAIIQLADNEYEIIDISKGGTYLNGKKINKDDPVVLNNGDKLRFGKEQFIFNKINLEFGECN